MTTLVLVEDHPLMLQLAAALLHDAFADLNVQCFADAESALFFLSNNSVDVVVSDIALPGLSGMALLEILHRQQPQLPVILQSIYDMKENHDLAVLLHAYRLLDKSLLGQQLVPTVRAALAARQGAT